MKHNNDLKRNDNSIPILSFFTGAGFLDLGFLKAGFPIIWHNEYEKSFSNGFNYAFDSMGLSDQTIQNTSSIIDIGPNKIAKEAFNNTPKPKMFGMIGGPPCPDFSVGGKNRGQKGLNGMLSEVYINRIIELQPTFFLFENVLGILRTKKHKDFLFTLKRKLEYHYDVDIKMLDALDYGVPQERKRVFMIGIKKNLKAKTIFEAREKGQSENWFHWPKPKFNTAKLKFTWPKTNPFGETPQKPIDIPDELMVGPLICDQEKLSKLPNSSDMFRPKSSKFTSVEEGDDSKKSFKRLHRWRYSPTAAYGNNEVHLHPTLPRRISVREALRIQSVPDSYALPKEMSLTHKFKTIGNGVPVRLAKAVAESISRTFQIIGE